MGPPLSKTTSRCGKDHVQYGKGGGDGPRPPKKTKKKPKKGTSRALLSKIAALVVALTGLVAGVHHIDNASPPVIEGVPSLWTPSPTPTPSKEITVSTGGGTGNDTALPDGDLGTMSQNFLNSYYAGWTRTWLNDVGFDLAYLSFPFKWYNTTYLTAEAFAREKQAYLDRAKAGHWKKNCRYYAADVREATLSPNGKDVIVDANVTQQPKDNCISSAQTAVELEYVLTPSPTAPLGYKIKSVWEIH